jgi:hypothetical protein
MANATVRIWWFLDGNAVARGTGLGHASLELPHVGRFNQQYITWAPNRNTEMGRANFYSFENDRDIYRNTVMETQELPMISRNNPCGLRQQAIDRWWQDISGVNSERRYAFLSEENNCDGTVVAALKAGGADLYAPCPWAKIRGAATLKRWVTALATEMQTMSAAVNRADRTLNMALHDVWHDTNGVWTLREWKARSAVAVGFRQEQVARIDLLLPRYHEAVAGGNAAAQLDALRAILAEVVDHLELKPRSDRRAAVTELGVQAFNQIEALLNPG